MKQVIERAELLRLEAGDIIENKGLDRILSKYGKPLYTGSYMLDTMVWRDLDISLMLNDNSNVVTTMVQIVKEISEKFILSRISVKDHRESEIEGLPKGVYTGLRFYNSASKWKIDLWAVNEKDYNGQVEKMDRFKSKMTEEDRRIIVSVKNSLINEEGSTPVMSSYYVYKAVLDDGIKDRVKIINKLKAEKRI